jgi:hypothetical protein
MHPKPFKRQCTPEFGSEEEVVVKEEASPSDAPEKDFPG